MKREQSQWKKCDLWDSTALLREKGGSGPADVRVGRDKETKQTFTGKQHSTWGKVTNF